MKENGQKLTAALLLMGAAGMMGAYTYVLRGGVFCNAQTGNMLKMGMAAGQGDWMKAAYFLLPMGAYMAGCYVAERFDMQRHFQWRPVLVAAEMAAFLGIGFIPLSVPDQLVQIAVNFVAAMQYSTFREAAGLPLVTTVCTSHIRSVGVSLAHLDREHGRRLAVHLGMVASFVGGAAVLTVFRHMGARACWLILAPLGASLFLLLEEQFQVHSLPHFHHFGV